MKHWSFLGAMVFFGLVSVVAQAGDAAIRVPVACDGAPSCGWRAITLAKARKEEMGLSEVNGDDYKLDSKVFSNDLFFCDYHWGPIRRFADGKKTIDDLQTRVRDGRPFGELPRSFVIAEDDRSNEAEQYLTLCSVNQVGDATGPPMDCVIVAIVTPNEVWLRGTMVPFKGCHATPNFSSLRPYDKKAVEVEFEVDADLDSDDFLDPMYSVLSERLDLVAKKTDRAPLGVGSGRRFVPGVEGVAPLRKSVVLHGGVEDSAYVTCRTHRHNGPLAILCSAYVLVAKPRVDERQVAYRGLDASEREAYRSALASMMAESIRPLCKTYRREGEKKIVCG